MGAAPAPAFAGAWVSVKEQSILTAAVGEQEDGWNYESGLYWEQPLDEGWSLVATPWSLNGPSAGPDYWKAETVISLKWAVSEREGAVSAAQAGLVWRSDLAECGETGMELRWLQGIAPRAWDGAFVNLEAAARVHDGGCAGARFDLTAGTRAGSDWLTLAELFTDAPEGGDLSVKAQLSFVWFGAEADIGGVQLGLRAPLDGADAPVMLVLGIWR